MQNFLKFSTSTDFLMIWLHAVDGSGTKPQKCRSQNPYPADCSDNPWSIVQTEAASAEILTFNELI